MSEFERQSYVSGTGKLDKNALEFSIDTTEKSLQVLMDQKDTKEKPSVALPGQIAALETKLADLRRQLAEIEVK